MLEKLVRFSLELLLYIKVQWLDRIQTSAFLVGITLVGPFQAYILMNLGDITEVAKLKFFVNSNLYALMAIMLLSSMSALNNDLRYDTYKNIILSNTSYFRVLLLRVGSMQVVSLPVILFPTLVVFSDHPVLVATLAILVSLTTLSFGLQSALLFTLFKTQKTTLGWLDILYVTIGCGLIEHPLIVNISTLFPPYWIRAYLQHGNWASIGMALALIVLLPTLLALVLVRLLHRKIEAIAADGRMAL